MKIIFVALLSLASVNTFAADTACTSANSQTKIARDAVKSLVTLADLNAPAIAYFGGMESNDNGLMVLNVLPYFRETKDWYKVTIRNSDCRVTNVNLYRENILLTLKERESLENGGF